MRDQLNMLDIKGVVVIGEGERDEAPMLYIGEEVGTGNGPEVDIALDPLEGTTLTAKDMPNALTVIAMAPRGTLLHAPDVYMEKLAIGPGYDKDVVSLDMAPAERVRALANARGVKDSDITVCILERPRHEDLIAEVRSTGAAIRLITDGDVAGVIHTTDPATRVDLYLGSGGAPEGVLACAALKCVGGQFQGRLVFRNDDERGRASRIGVTDFSKKYTLHELVSGDAVFAATGVTKGAMLDGVRRRFFYGVSLAYVGRHFDQQENFPYARVALDSYLLAGSRIGYRVTRDVELFARVSNAFGDRYQDLAGYRTEGRGLFAGLRFAGGSD